MNNQIMYERLKNNKYFQYFMLKESVEIDLIRLTKEEKLEHWKNETKLLQPFMNQYENPYLNIKHMEKDMGYIIAPGDMICIQEKLDGSNSHLIVTENGFQCFGMNFILNEKNHLQGFYFWAKDNYMKIKEKYYGLKIFGEWLVPHHCDYKDNYYGEFYIFDIMQDNEYWDQERVLDFCRETRLNSVPILYTGKFISWKHIKSFVGKTSMGTDIGEGIVVKNQSRLNKADKYFYIKIVSEKFQETNPIRKFVKIISDEELEKEDNKVQIVESIVTLARIRKIILKYVDIKALPYNWQIMKTKDILKTIKTKVIQDCYKEEILLVNQVGKRFSIYADAILKNNIEQLKKDVF